MGVQSVTLSPEMLIQLKDSINCYKEVFTTKTTITFYCFMKGIDEGFTKLEDMAEVEAQKELFEASGAEVVDLTD